MMSTTTKLKKYRFEAKVWKYDGHAGWYFVTLPKILSQTIRKNHSLSEEGWGRMKTNASIGKCDWETAIWFDTKAASYLLPIKASVRKTAKIEAGSKISVTLQLQVVRSSFKFL